MSFRRPFLFPVAALACLLWISQASWATQLVFLNFQSGSINYTSSMRADIVDGMQTVYDDFDIEIQDTQPAAPFSTINFNVGGPGGLAEQIDFRNLDASDSADVNVSGLGLSPSQYVGASITIGSHELGHLLGLRHGDSFGPIGTGLSVPGPSPGNYLPTFPGPSGGNEVVNFVMGTPAYGVPISTVSNPHWLSERSATKVAFAEQGTVLNEAPGSKNTLASAQTITLPNIGVPNTIVSGANAGLGDPFSVDAVSLLGSLSTPGEMDLYSFDAQQGDLFNIEVMSSVIGQRISNVIDSQISILDAQGSLINYWGSDAFNDDELESLDSILLDLTIPANGTYYMQVNAFSSDDTGSYELFAYRFNGAEQALAGDFDGDGDYACADVDALVAEIVAGTNNTTYDLNADDAVNQADLTAWLTTAGAVELASGNAYLLGDANLDGFVDGRDLLTWNANKLTSTAAWCAGDFDASGFIDEDDFDIWNNHKFMSALESRDAATKRNHGDSFLILNVPEPATGGWLAGLMLGALTQLRKPRCR